MKRESEDTVALVEHTDGILIPIQAQPRARQNAVVGVHAGRLKITVTQAPEKGRANDAIVKTLAQALSLKSSQLNLRSGTASKKKTVLVLGIDMHELRRRIADAYSSS